MRLLSYCLQLKYEELKRSMDELTTSAVDGFLEKIRLLASCPIPEFNRFEALNIAAQDAKHEKVGYYKYTFETLREKVALQNDQFCNFLLLLLGDKDQERILDVIAKVEKNNCRNPVKQNFRAAGRAVSAPSLLLLQSFWARQIALFTTEKGNGGFRCFCGPSQQSQSTNRDK